MNVVPNKPGIYRLTHRLTRDTYVGMAADLRCRLLAHFADMRANRHHNAALASLCAKHGIDFDIEVLQIVDVSVLRAAELDWISRTKPTLNVMDTAGYATKPRRRKLILIKKVGISAMVDFRLAEAVREMARQDSCTVSYIVEKAIRAFVDGR